MVTHLKILALFNMLWIQFHGPEESHVDLKFFLKVKKGTKVLKKAGNFSGLQFSSQHLW